MTAYEYKVVPAPERGLKAKGVKSAEARFAHALADVMNQLAADGWEYQRSETLPSEERQGLTGKAVVFRNMLVFRRKREEPVAMFTPRVLGPSVEDMEADAREEAGDPDLRDSAPDEDRDVEGEEDEDETPARG